MTPSDPTGSRLTPFLPLAALALGTEALGWVSGLLGTPGILLALAAGVAITVAGVAWLRTMRAAHRRQVAGLLADIARLTPLQDAIAERAERHRKLRHDLRGALSPALLTADRLLGNADPKVKRAGEMMVMAVERASALMTDD